MKPAIRERNGRFTVSVEVWHNGDRKTLSAGTHASRDEAEQAGWQLALRYLDSEEDRAQAQSTLTLEQWSAQWLRGLPAEVKDSTTDTYRWRMAHWVVPHLGSKKLVDLTPGVIRRWLDDLTQGPDDKEAGSKKKGRNLSFRSRKAALTVLSSCLTAAKERGLCNNPTEEVVLKQSKARAAGMKGKVRIWNTEDTQKLLGTGHALAVLGIYGGLRRGEVLGLEWNDVDWLEGTVNVSRNVVQTAYRVLDDETPKSGASRVVHLPPAAIDALMMYKASQEALEGPQERIFTGTPSQAQKAFDRLCKAAGVPLLGMHSTRHTCASLLLSQGVSLVAVAKHLGHSKPDVTLRVYSHFMPQDTGKCAEALASVLVVPGTLPLTTPVNVAATMSVSAGQ